MAKCWTCGATVSGYHYNCPSCQSLTELKNLQKKVESYSGNISDRLSYMAQVQQDGFNALRDMISTDLSEIASAIEWGFGELSWQLQQQTDVLRSIDHTLKTPGETQANEWRKMAEELRNRGVLDESEEFYLKALDLNRLDYRIYVGLAETYLQMSKFDKARTFLEKSLPHAPKREIDYKSYSYRLIGHIYACEEHYAHAYSVLRSSIELSPKYIDGHYDYAQYCAVLGKKEDSLASLQKAILDKPLCFYLSQKERNFDPIKRDVQNLLITTGLTHTLSPDYYDGLFQLVKYCAQTRNAETCISVLQKLIISEPNYFYLAQKERNLDHMRSEVQSLLTEISTEAFRRSKDAIAKLENALKEAHEAVFKAEQALRVSRDKTELESSAIFENVEAKLKLAKDKVASGDYVAFLKAKPIAEEAHALACNAINTADGEREYYQRRRVEKVKNAWLRVPGAIIGWPLLFWILGTIAAGIIALIFYGIVGLFSAESTADTVAEIVFVFVVLIAIGLGFYTGIIRIKKELD